MSGCRAVHEAGKVTAPSIAINALWIVCEFASVANAAIARRRNLIHIDVLDALANFAVSVECAAAAIRAMARAIA